MYRQTEGGPIGLDLTGALSRPFMMRWDRMYLDRVKKAGIKMRFYKRYVDDSNQVATVPPAGSRYDVIRRKVVQDATVTGDDDEEKRTVKILKDIANTIQEGIIMEEDSPSKHCDKKVPILDMKVWLSSDGYLLYQHYGKEVASRQIISAKSAQSATCKRNVHIQEVLRRMLNCSTRLNWQEEVAPFLTDYMARMFEAGYGETYRKNTLENMHSGYMTG